MPTQPMNNDVALPHASLLAYFRSPRSSPQSPNHGSAPPPYNIRDTSNSGYFSSAAQYKVDDEESDYGFWGEGDSSEEECSGMRLRMVKRDHQGFYSFCCFWCAVLVCMIGGIGIIFTTDLALTALGMGTGVAKLLVDASTNAGESYDMHFCLVSTNRDVPGPQIWRHIKVDDIARCKTDVLTLSAASTEHWKLRLDDQSLFGDDVPHEAKESQFMDVDKEAHVEGY
ncbi:hypothetical protein DE146DRAFT_329692 [Phaeosphaeria sp. MPI-PUGE-AT-0046c]|nr:hypothetical protein DE146DRAFT_329692 [Phaeosphaeria sp. MPI-PUGE-AT-0046c]